jgi:serine/threonine protein kinase
VVGGLKQGDPQLIGPYRLVGHLGGGGMGQVFLGLSAGGRPVAVKVIRPELAADQEFRLRFDREVAAARRVGGLFTALVVDADVDGPVPWLATAYVAGPSLSEAVTRYGPMPVLPALALAAGLAEGLSAIHAAGVVHCDLKPSNVLLGQDGPRVIDFGISRAVEAASVTGAGLVVGSAGFMSPEQALGEEIGPPSDIFSLGAVLTFAATGGGPFGRGSSPELAYRLVYGTPGLDQLPAELRPLVEQCLAKDPGRRPTADEVLDAANARQPAAGWPLALPPGPSPVLVPGPRQPSTLSQPVSPPRPARRAWWRPLMAAGVAAAMAAACVAVSFALSGTPGRSSAAYLVPGAMPTLAAPAASGPSRPASRSSSRGPAPKPAIVPAMIAVTSPAPSPSPTAPPSKPPSVSPSPSGSPSPGPSLTASPSPTPTPSATPSLLSPSPAPQITSVQTYRQGQQVYFDIQYADPGNDAEGFGFTGVNGSSWLAETYPFASPGPGVVGPDSIAYPLDLECGTAGQHTAEVEAWIYDAAGARSQPVMIQLACDPVMPPGRSS